MELPRSFIEKSEDCIKQENGLIGGRKRALDKARHVSCQHIFLMLFLEKKKSKKCEMKAGRPGGGEQTLYWDAVLSCLTLLARVSVAVSQREGNLAPRYYLCPWTLSF